MSLVLFHISPSIVPSLLTYTIPIPNSEPNKQRIATKQIHLYEDRSIHTYL